MATSADPQPVLDLPGAHTRLNWWLAAGLVGADIGTSVFYSTGILLPFVGFAAPFFILIVALAMWLFKATYQEGTAVTPINGGAYTMVLQTVGRRVALVVGSMTILSYLATAVVSALSGAYYLSSLWPEGSWHTLLIVITATVPIVTFAVLNLFGLKESTRLVFGIAAFHFGMLIVMDLWGLFIAFTHGAHWDRLSHGLVSLGPKGALMGFASAFLGITGFESAAQIVEEIELPTFQSMRKIYVTIVGLVSFTAPVSSMLALILLSDQQIKQYSDNILSGLAFVIGGRPLLVLLVLNACLTLFAAVNTAYAGATGLITTMGRQGNLPIIVLQQWTERVKAFKGYPFVALPFMLLCMMLLISLPGSVDQLGSIYGMAFLGVMISYSAGVILQRLFLPHKIARSPYLSAWSVMLRRVRIPLSPVFGGALLLVAELVLLATAKEARSLGIQLFLVVLLVMVFFRLGKVERRMVRLPDLRLGLGQFREVAPLPTDLPVHVICTGSANPNFLVTLISYVLGQAQEQPIEVVVFHAKGDRESGVVSGALERVISQQLEDFFTERDFILAVKVLPGNLDEVLLEYKKAKPMNAVYLTRGRRSADPEERRRHLADELGVEVVLLDEEKLPKGPSAWFDQWVQGFLHRRKD